MSTQHTDIATLRHDMVDTCRKMNASGINQGTAGNLSVRTKTGFSSRRPRLPMTR